MSGVEIPIAVLLAVVHSLWDVGCLAPVEIPDALVRMAAVAVLCGLHGFCLMLVGHL